jgi:ferredoxin
MIAVVDQAACANCGLCVDACRRRAITMGEVLVIDAALCTGCGACVAECPRGALSLVPLPLAEQGRQG